MSNLERDPAEVIVGDDVVVADAGVEILEPREVPLGGPRAMTVRRTLPQRKRSLIGGWCFIDHYGPDDVAATGGMRVPPHPHTGLQTVSWLFEGEIEHRDSVGSHALVRPGELNLMTAGRGISHSEVSTPGTERLHGVQLWVALPSASRDVAPFFEHHAPSPATLWAASVRTFVGALAGSGTDATVFSPLVGAEVLLPAGASVELPLDTGFEHGILALPGAVTATEVQAALELGLDTVKFFPAGTSGGAAAIKALAAPFGQVRFVPTGGVGPANLGEYLAIGSVVAVGGSWMVPADRVAAHDRTGLVDLISAAVATARAARPAA